MQFSVFLLKLHFFDSGDTDSVVPLTATRYSIGALKLKTLKNWYPWYYDGKVRHKNPFYYATTCSCALLRCFGTISCSLHV